CSCTLRPDALKLLTLPSVNALMGDQKANMTLLCWVSLLLLADQQLSSELHMSTSSKRPTKSKGKAKITEEEMKYKNQRVRMPEFQVECDLDIRDSELSHIDMEDFWARTKRVMGSPWMDKL
ncbi:hypothetical protein KI387_025501, partial [Taxus chinensis]